MSLILVGGIMISYVFNMGEVYVYTNTYKRAFFYYSDDVTTVLTLLFCWAYLLSYFTLSVFILLAIFLSGGKVAFILLSLMLIIHILREVEHREKLIKKLGVIFLCSTLIFLCFISIAKTVHECNWDTALKFYLEETFKMKSPKVQGAGACNDKQEIHCFITQSTTAIEQRYYSSLAGIWMISQGGFSGATFPGSPEKFAALMMRNNPWGINDRYNIGKQDWIEMGGVQSPYIAFGAGYGLYMLLVLVAFFLILLIVSIQCLRYRKVGKLDGVFIVFFCVITIFNQTQSWLQSYSYILISLGASTFFICRTYFFEQSKHSMFRTVIGRKNTFSDDLDED